MSVAETQSGGRDDVAPEQGQEEGILRDVLAELDRERIKRTRIEEELRSKLLLESKNHLGDQQKESSEFRTKQEWTALETERNEYRELLDMLLQKNDAVSSAKTNDNPNALPHHVIRMLELMPWDNRVQQYSMAIEEVYEWQVYKSNHWQGILRYFPASFRKLPIIQPKPGEIVTEEEPVRRNLFGGESPPKQCVLTNDGITKIIKIDNGYPLPHEGGAEWKWVTGWRIEKRITVGETPRGTSPKFKVDVDGDGWSYAEQADHFVSSPTELCWGSPNQGGSTRIKRTIRRRKWTRQRALVGYPNCSPRTRQFLKLTAENARLSVTATKLSDQLVDTKTKLTETEDKLLLTQQERDHLANSLATREDELMRLLDHTAKLDSKTTRSNRSVNDNKDESTIKSNVDKMPSWTDAFGRSASLREELVTTELAKPPKDAEKETRSHPSTAQAAPAKEAIAPSNDPAPREMSQPNNPTVSIEKVRGFATSFVSSSSNYLSSASNAFLSTTSKLSAPEDTITMTGEASVESKQTAPDGEQKASSFNWKKTVGRGGALVLDQIKTKSPAIISGISNQAQTISAQAQSIMLANSSSAGVKSPIRSRAGTEEAAGALPLKERQNGDQDIQ